MRHLQQIGFILLFASALQAQTGLGSIQGTVTDPSGAMVPNASIVAVHVETGTSFKTVTNGAGFFLFPAMQTGKYHVSTEVAGMEKWEGDLLLEAGQDAVIAPSLKLGGTASQVTVAGDVTPLVTTNSPTLASVADRNRIDQLPLNGRFFQNLLIVTTPGLESGLSGANNAQAYGLRDETMQYVQDGASIKDLDTGQLQNRPPGLDTIQEYRIEMSVPSAKFDVPVTTVLTTRSGTNDWHGSLFYTGRNNGFGVARERQDFFTKAPQYILNEYGASLGGPVRIPHLYNGKDKTFFFAAWEAYSLRSSATMNTSVPTQAMEQGNFQGLTDATGQAITLYDPYSTGSKASNYTRTPYPGNVIPITERSPLAAYFYSVMPQATQAGVNPSLGANYFGPDPLKQNDWTFTTRVDHRLSDNDQIFGRFTTGNTFLRDRRTSNDTTPITSDGYWNFSVVDESNETAVFNWNHIFGPSFFMQTVLTGSHINWRFDQQAQTSSQRIASQLGVPNVFGIGGAPNIGDIGWSLTGVGNIPRGEVSQPLAVEQNYTKVVGRHQFEFGWRFQRMYLDVLPDGPGEGTIDFASDATGIYAPGTGTAYGAQTRTGDNSANFFLGVASSYAQTLQAPIFHLRSNEASGYGQDTWRLTGGLTLTLGLRYDYLQPLLDANGNNPIFDFATGAIVRQASLSQLIAEGGTTQAIINQFAAIGVKFQTPQQAGLTGDLIHVGQLNFSPRAGLAYSWKVGRRSVVFRGGFGTYHSTLGARLWNAAQRSDAPLQGTVSYNISSAALSPDGFANYGLRSVPAVIAGTSSAVNAINPNAANAVAPGITVSTFAPNLPATMEREWNITAETEIFRNTLLRVAYIATQGRNLDETIDQNGEPNTYPYVYYVETGKALPTGTYASTALRDYNQTTYGTIAVQSQTGFSNYNGMQVEVQRRFNHGLAFQWYYVMSNAMWTGSGSQISSTSSVLPDPISFLPGEVPSNFNAYNRFYNYSRDPNIPKHRVNWNFIYDLPFGRGKKFLSNSGAVMDRIVGGWQLASYMTMNSRYITLPATNFGPFGKVQIYGMKYPVENCVSGTCIRGYLWYNGYIPPNQINKTNAAGQCTGICGIPSNYTPSNQPIDNNPNGANFGTNDVLVPLQNGNNQLVAFNNGLDPWRNQYILGPWAFTVNSSLFKVIPLTERMKLRLNMDFFNVLNNPGTPLPASTGVIGLQVSNQAPRELQWTARVTW